VEVLLPQRATLSAYLRSLLRLCLEVLRRPSPLPVFLRILALVPQTLMELK
jgi:hypothetical protein